MALEYTQFYKKWFSSSTPLAGVKAVGTLTFTGVVADTQTVTIGSEVYEFDTTGAVTAGRILVDVSGGVTASDAVTALVAAITANSAIVTAVDGTGDTVVVTYKWVGTDGNSIATTETLTNGSWGDTTLKTGQFATPVSCPCFIIISGVWYIADAPVEKHTLGGWKSATPA